MLVVTALGTVLLLGIAALSIDAGFMYEKRNRLHAAADAAAKSAAIEVHLNAGATGAALLAFANDQVQAHGFTPAACGAATNAAVCVNHPPVAPSAYAGDPNFVQVSVSEQTTTFFGTFLGWAHLAPGATATAGTSHGPNCFILFDTLDWKNNDSMTLNNCNAAFGGNLDIGGDTITGSGSATIAVAGTYTNGGHVTPAPTTGVPAPSDPLAGLPTPAIPVHACTTPWPVPADTTLTLADVDKYVCGIAFGSHAVTFAASTTPYVINGAVTANNGGTDVTLTTNQATLYIGPAGSFDVSDSNHVAISLTAPQSGSYKGIAFYQDPANAAAVGFAKNAGGHSGTLSLDGAMYAKAATITMKNNDAIASCSLIIANAITQKNNGSIAMTNTCGNFGGSPLLTVAMAE